MENRVNGERFRPDLGELTVDLASLSMNKHHESLCGDFYTMSSHNGRHVLVLADGLGSGVKANILATLTAKMLSTMIAGNIPSEDAVRTVAKTLPVCKVRHLAYSAFTVLTMEGSQVELLQFDNPDAILIRNGVPYDYPYESIMVDDKEIHVSRFTIQETDMLLLMSDGVTNAGVGKTNYSGWGREDVVRCCRKWYHPGITSYEMALAIANAGYALNLEVTVDDLTVVALQFCQPRPVNIMIGPPGDPSQDSEYLKNFFRRSGRHVICGGSTAQMAAKYLGEQVIPLPDTMTEEVPARSIIHGVDLVTEGVLTLEHTLEQMQDLRKYPLDYLQLAKAQDGASLLTEMLLGSATQINVFFGNASNEGYADLGDYAHDKEQTVNDLIRLLREYHKEVNIIYWAV